MKSAACLRKRLADGERMVYSFLKHTGHCSTLRRSSRCEEYRFSVVRRTQQHPINSLLIRLVQESNIVDGNTLVGVLLDILDKLVGISLSPVSSGTVCASDTTEEATIVLVAVVLHVVIGGPGISVDGLDTTSDGLLGKPDLLVVSVDCVKGKVAGLDGTSV